MVNVHALVPEASKSFTISLISVLVVQLRLSGQSPFIPVSLCLFPEQCKVCG